MRLFLPLLLYSRVCLAADPLGTFAVKHSTPEAPSVAISSAQAANLGAGAAPLMVVPEKASTEPVHPAAAENRPRPRRRRGQPVTVPGAYTLECPKGWRIQKGAPNDPAARTSCFLGTKGPKLEVSRVFQSRETNSGAIEKAVDAAGESVFKRDMILGRKSAFVSGPGSTAVYIPGRQGYYRLGYDAPRRLLPRYSKAFQDAIATFRLLSPCSIGAAPGRAKIRIPREARQWSALPVRVDTGTISITSFFKSGKKKFPVARSYAAVYKAGEDCQLVVSVFPKILLAKKTHFEIRFKFTEMVLDGVEARKVTIEAEVPADQRRDSVSLKEQGIAYSEESPSTASLLLQNIDPGSKEIAENSGILTADFATKDIGRMSLGYDITGVEVDW